MNHSLHHVVAFEAVGGYRLRIQFDDAAVRTIDFEPILYGELYGPLREPNMFQTVRIDPEFKTIVWANGADFDPSTLHDWPNHEQDWLRLVTRWRGRQSAESVVSTSHR